MDDILIFESGSGGEFQLLGNDIATTSALYNQVYLALFGGNVLESTRVSYAPGEQRGDWWGNTLLLPENPESQFNSQTERVLQNVVLNSSGRVAVEEAVKADIAYLADLGETQVSVIFDEQNRVNITVRINEPTEKKPQEFNYIWDSAKGELIETLII